MEHLVHELLEGRLALLDTLDLDRQVGREPRDLQEALSNFADEGPHAIDQDTVNLPANAGLDIFPDYYRSAAPHVPERILAHTHTHKIRENDLPTTTGVQMAANLRSECVKAQG